MKTCVDCKWRDTIVRVYELFKVAHEEKIFVCQHADATTDPVTGEERVMTCEKARRADGHCGLRGLAWEAKE